MNKHFIKFAPPSIGQKEIDEVVDTLRSDWITTGPKTRRFEAEFANYLGGRAALALNSCTAGLHTALMALGVGRGDEVITTPMTFAASVNVIEHVGATPVLVDVEPDTLNLDPARVEAAITPRTRVILPVHFAGHPVDLDPILELARRWGIMIVEDAAHALPARYRGRMIGSGGNPVAFSFYATKNLTTAEGGMLLADPELIDRARIISMHGMSRNSWNRYDAGGNWYYEVVLPGFKYNMTDLQAALGLQQLRRLDGFQRRRRQIVAAYQAAFRVIGALEVPTERPDVEHAWHLYVLRLRPEALRIDRGRFIDELRERGIGASVHFIPINMHRYYKYKYFYKYNQFPVAGANYERMFSLPLHPGLSDDDVSRVVEAVMDIIAKYRR